MSYFKEVIEKYQKNLKEATDNYQKHQKHLVETERKKRSDEINHEAKFNYIGRRCYKHISNILFNKDKLMKSMYNYDYYKSTHYFSIDHKCPYTGIFVKKNQFLLYVTCQDEIIKYINSQSKMQNNNIKMIDIKRYRSDCTSTFTYN